MDFSDLAPPVAFQPSPDDEMRFRETSLQLERASREQLLKMARDLLRQVLVVYPAMHRQLIRQVTLRSIPVDQRQLEPHQPS